MNEMSAVEVRKPRSSYLTKTAFKLARTCPTKLYYHLTGYASSIDDNEFVQMLSEGGHQIGALARLMYGPGELIDLEGGIEAALTRTRHLMERPEVTLFEGVFESGRKLVSVDVLVKRGSLIKLIEVKTKSYDSAEDAQQKAKGGVSFFLNAKGSAFASEWQPYIEDVAFQKLVLEELYPQATIHCALLLPDKARTLTCDRLIESFAVRRSAAGGVRVACAMATLPAGAADFLAEVPIEREVSMAMNVVREESARFLKSLSPALVKIPTKISCDCKDCEFQHANEAERSGYRECWGKRADPRPHIFDLFHGTGIKVDGERILDNLIEEGRTSLFDVPLEVLKGKRGERQRVQIEHSRCKSEWKSAELKDLLATFAYPHFFIDFETTKSAFPWYAGMRPFEDLAFQWSCHAVRAPGAAPEHFEWINEEDVFPNISFARALRNTIGNEGTVFTWASHERTILKGIRERALAGGKSEQELADWLDLLLKGERIQGRLVDMNDIALQHYFHPDMKGKTSLKYVLPAVWNASASILSTPWLAPYVERLSDGTLKNPYEVLPPIEIEGVPAAVREGTAAMIAYEQLIRGPAGERATWKKLLLQYCKLDTLAMVVVCNHWAA